MVNVEFWALEEEEGVVVNPFRAPIKMQECRDVLLCIWRIHQFCRFEVEVRSVELECLLVIRHAQPKMSQLVYRRRSLLEALCLVHGSVFVRREIVRKFWEGLRNLHGRLAIH